MEEQKKKAPLWSLLAAVVLAVACGYIVYHYVGGSRAPIVSTDLPAIGGPFELIDQDGQTVTDEDFDGRYILVYFGYTYCPDLCATALTNVTKSINLLGDQGDQVTPVFITLDPERDNVEQLKMYAEFFHPRLIALTGTKDKIARVAEAYRVYFAKVEKQGGDPDDYIFDHTSIIYLMGPDGHYRAHFTEESTPEKMAERMREVL